MTSVQHKEMSLDEIYALSYKALTVHGCDDANAAAISDIVMRAERDGSTSHGMFRLPGYIGSIRSGKVIADARPEISHSLPAVVKVEKAWFCATCFTGWLAVLTTPLRRLGLPL